MQLVRNDVTSQLQPRHSCRRERHPGARERHSTMKRRLCSDVDSQPSNTRLMTSQVRSSYCMTSASQYQRIGQSEVEVVTENSNVISAMKDLSTIEAIRESMRSTEKQQPFSEIKHRSIPTWMLGLDLNLDVTAVDIIPPFEQTSNSDEVTYDEQPTVTFINDDEEDIDLHDNYLELFPNEMETEYGRTIKSPEAVQAAGNTRTISISPTVSNRPPSSSPDGRGSRGTPRSQSRSSELTLSQTNPGILRSKSLLKTIWEKEKLLVTSNFSFSHSAFYPFGKLSAIFINFKNVVCKIFEFGRV